MTSLVPWVVEGKMSVNWRGIVSNLKRSRAVVLACGPHFTGMVDNLSWAPPLRPAGTAAYDRTLGEDFGGLAPGNLAHSVFLG